MLSTDPGPLLSLLREVCVTWRVRHQDENSPVLGGREKLCLNANERQQNSPEEK